MQFTTSFVSAAAVILAFTGSISAAPSAAPEDAPWSCTPVVQGSPSTAYPNRLATFDVFWYGWEFPGFYISTYGNYNQCFNFDPNAPYTRGTGSILLTDSKSAGCWVYPVPDCQGDYTIITPAGNKLYDGKVKSFQCDFPAAGSS